jgi:hypothetical protein
MNSGFIINEKNELQELETKNFPAQPKSLKIFARIISYIFHPVFVPVYIVLFMVYVHPFMFLGLSMWDKTRVVLMGILMFAFFPMITVGLLKALDFIQSIQLKTQKDRIIPLVACGVWYFWIWYVWRNQQGYPAAAVKLTLAIWISVSIALMANIMMKISLHCIATGVMLGFILLLAFNEPINYGFYITVALLITGLVCTARFIDSDHSPREIYGGLLLGIMSMMVAWLLG